MDGLNGAYAEFGFMPLLHERAYQLVDNRYNRHLVGQPGGPSEAEAVSARVVNSIELFVYSWMSILVAAGIATRSRWHKTLEAAVLTMAAYGTVVFVVPDFLTGCPNMQPFAEHTCLPPLTPFYAFFVYFGVTINIIWFVVPLRMLWNNVKTDLDVKKN